MIVVSVCWVHLFLTFCASSLLFDICSLENTLPFNFLVSNKFKICLEYHVHLNRMGFLLFDL